MNKKIYLLTGLIAIVLSVITAFFDYRISFGILLTISFSLLNLFLLSASMKSLLKSGDISGYPLLMGVNILRFGMLAAVIYIAIKNPEIFNIYGVTAGLILFLFSLLIDTATRKES